MACPFFFPIERADDLAFPHPRRLPLGGAWRGRCEASGQEGAPRTVELESCNLGYAKTCPRLPAERSCDAVRFGIASHSAQRITLQFVLETDYLPAGGGVLEYDCETKKWRSPLSDARIQKMAECFLQSVLDRKP